MKTNYLEKLKKTQLEMLDYFVKICEENNLNYFLIGGTLLGAVRHRGYIPWDDDLDVGMPRNDYEKFLKIFKESEKFILDCNVNDKYWLPFAKIRNKKTEYVEDMQINYQGGKGIWIDIFPLDNGNKEKSCLEYLQFKLTFFLRRSIGYKLHINLKGGHAYSHILATIFSIFPYKFLTWIQYKIMTLNKNKNSKYFINLGSQYGYTKQVHLKEKYLPTKKLIFEEKEYNVPNDYEYVLKKIYGNRYMDLPPIEKRITHNPIKVKFEDGEEVEFSNEE